jgi:hypothetical protein
MAAERAAADAAVAGHAAAEVVRGREHWLYFTHPEQPVAGADVAIYFNNNVSDILRCCWPNTPFRGMVCSIWDARLFSYYLVS